MPCCKDYPPLVPLSELSEWSYDLELQGVILQYEHCSMHAVLYIAHENGTR